MSEKSNMNEISPLRKYVKTKVEKDILNLEKAALEWIKISVKNRLVYEIDWLGIPIIQTPEEMILLQELIFTIKPDYIIETGIAHGGSIIYYASICQLIGKGEVIGIDIDIRKHNRRVIEKHNMFKRVKLIQGSSTNETTLKKVSEIVPKGSTVLVCLDSNHTCDHVLSELKLYKQFVSPGGYIVVFDTITSRLASEGVCDKIYLNNGPSEAVEKFLKIDKDFEIDNKYDKLFITYSPKGFLRRIK